METLSGRRREIAAVVSEERRTLYEIAKALGLRSGDVRGMVHRMHRDEILLADSSVLAEGTQFWLSPDCKPQLDEPADGDDTPAGTIRSGQRLIEVTVADRTRLCSLLQRQDLTACVSWSVELGEERLLLGVRPDASVLQVERLRAALASAGMVNRGGQAGVPLTSDEMRRHALAVTDAAEFVQK